MLFRSDSRVAGIPCVVAVTHFTSVRGSYHYDAPSDLDYYGYTESNWFLKDRKGYPATWLENKLTDEDRSRIETQIEEAMKNAGP